MRWCKQLPPLNCFCSAFPIEQLSNDVQLIVLAAVCSSTSGAMSMVSSSEASEAVRRVAQADAHSTRFFSQLGDSVSGGFETPMQRILQIMMMLLATSTVCQWALGHNKESVVMILLNILKQKTRVARHRGTQRRVSRVSRPIAVLISS